MHRRHALRATLTALAFAATTLAAPASAQNNAPFKIGFILPMTGQSASTGKQIEAAVKLWQAQNGTTVAGRKVEVIVKDDAGVADTTRRIAQELVVNDKVDVLAGFGLTPLALATAPIATQSKTPMVVTAAATSMITTTSPYIVRTSFTLPQATVPIADWAAKNGIKRVVTFVADYGPGLDAEKFFKSQFQLNGGQIVGELRVLKGVDVLIKALAELAGRGLKVDYHSVWDFVHAEKLSFKKKRGGWRTRSTRGREAASPVDKISRSRRS